jgi:hypothetical protein
MPVIFVIYVAEFVCPPPVIDGYPRPKNFTIGMKNTILI